MDNTWLRIVFAVVVYSFSVGEYITKIRVGALKHDVPDHIFFTFMYTGCLVFFKNFYSIVWIWYRLRQRCTTNKKNHLSTRDFLPPHNNLIALYFLLCAVIFCMIYSSWIMYMFGNNEAEPFADNDKTFIYNLIEKD